MEPEGSRHIEARSLSRSNVNERRESGDGLIDFGPELGAFVSVVVGGRDAFRHALQPGNCADRPTILGDDIRSNHASERAMVAFDAHDARRGDTQLTRAEIAHSYEISCDKRVF